MATPDKLNLLYTTLSTNDASRYGGYHRELFTRAFTILEEALVICTLCQGVKKDACVYQGMTTCKPCSSCPDKAMPVKDIRELVRQLYIKCPLAPRGCNWTGKASEGENHLQNCKELLSKCPNNCGAGINRKTRDQHLKLCQMRVLPCEYCGEELIANNLPSHLLICTLHPMSCQNCQTEMERKQEVEHLKICPAREHNPVESVPVAPLEVIVAQNVSEYKGNGNYSVLERETEKLKERVSSLEKKNQILTKALFSKPELMKYDSTTGRILEGFKWRLEGVTGLTKSVSTLQSPSFYIWHHNMRVTAETGLMGSMSLCLTRVQGCYDEIVQETCVAYFKSELVPVDEGKCLEFSGRINHKLELNSRSNPFLFIELSNLRDQLYTTDDSVTFHFYFDMIR